MFYNTNLDHVKGQKMYIDELLNSILKMFELEERYREMLREWDDLLPPLVSKQNLKKSKRDCLNILVSHLSDIQTSFPTEYNSEVILKQY